MALVLTIVITTIIIIISFVYFLYRFSKFSYKVGREDGFKVCADIVSKAVITYFKDLGLTEKELQITIKKIDDIIKEQVNEKTNCFL